MADPVLELEGITRSFGALVASDKVSIDLRPGEIHALIGPNGAGKTTLIKQIAGEILPDAGAIRFNGADITKEPPARRAMLGLARTFQISALAPEFSALAMRPKVFLMDEPMAGMGPDGSQRLTRLLADLKTEAPILLVEHDMDAVFALADRISVMVYGKVVATGTGNEIRANALVREAYLGEEA